MTDGAEASTDDTDEIVVLDGLEAVRRRPWMYVGAADERGLRCLVDEVVDSSVQDARAGCARSIHVTLLADGGARVADDGCGLPVGPDAGTPAVEELMTQLSCGTVPTRHPQVSGARSGVGLAVVNALSARLEVEVRRHGHVWRQSYRHGVPDAPLAQGEPTTTTGTTTTFWADPEIFCPTDHDGDALRSRLRQLADLTEGLRTTLTDERDRPTDPEVTRG